MRPFTDEEFEIMISELTDEAHSSYNMLCKIAENVLRPKVKYWCAADSVLRGRGMEDDIMQDVFMRLIKTVNDKFLIREDHNWEINRDPDGFLKWIVTVAKNIKNDTANAIRNYDYRVRGFEDGEENSIPDARYDDEMIEEYRRDKLKKSFKIVFVSGKEIYIILTWLVCSLIMLVYDTTQIETIRIMEAVLSEKTLFYMRNAVLGYAKKIRWVNISDNQVEVMDKALKSVYKDDLYGNCKYKEFFMKKGGRKSISDWLNRVNSLIKLVIKYESPES